MLFTNITITGVMMDRSSKAPLSLSELASLRRLRSDPSREIRTDIATSFCRWSLLVTT